MHGLLAADLWLRGPVRQDTGRNDSTCTAKEKGTKPAITPAWSAVLPTQADFEESMPLLWHEQTQKLLPPTVTDLVAKQSAKLEKDWATVWEVFGAGGGSEGATDAAATSSGPEHRRMQAGTNRGKKRGVNDAPKGPKTSDDSEMAQKTPEHDPEIASLISSTDNEVAAKAAYMYAWMVVNTRTFYFVHSSRGKLSPTDADEAAVDREDRMALQPVADLFNHHGEAPRSADDPPPSPVSFDGAGFTIRAGRRYRRGEEVCISYGHHSNDFLLAEYGFVLEHNHHDEVQLDEAILPRLSPEQRDELEAAGFLGRYALDARTVCCYRAEVAVRLLCAYDEGGAAGDKGGRLGRLKAPKKTWKKRLTGSAATQGLDGWRRFVRGELDDLMAAKVPWRRKLMEILRSYRHFVDQRGSVVDALEAQNLGLESQRRVLRMRWKQIGDLVDSSIQKLESRSDVVECAS